MRDYYRQQYASKMANLEEMDKFLEKHNLSRLNQEEIDNINRPITNTIDKSNGILKKCSSNPQEDKKKKIEMEKRESTSRKET